MGTSTQKTSQKLIKRNKTKSKEIIKEFWIRKKIGEDNH
jgi:hypothetical protein